MAASKKSSASLIKRSAIQLADAKGEWLDPELKIARREFLTSTLQIPLLRPFT